MPTPPNYGETWVILAGRRWENFGDEYAAIAARQKSELNIDFEHLPGARSHDDLNEFYFNATDIAGDVPVGFPDYASASLRQGWNDEPPVSLDPVKAFWWDGFKIEARKRILAGMTRLLVVMFLEDVYRVGTGGQGGRVASA